MLGVIHGGEFTGFRRRGVPPNKNPVTKKTAITIRKSWGRAPTVG